MSETWLINENPTLAPYTQNTINEQGFKSNNIQFIAMKFNKTPFGNPTDAMTIEYQAESAMPIESNYKHVYKFKDNPNFNQQYEIYLNINFKCAGFDFKKITVYNRAMTYTYKNTTRSVYIYNNSNGQQIWKEDAKTIITEDLTPEQQSFLNTYATYIGEYQNNNSIKVYDTTTTTWTNNEYKTVEFENEPTGDLLAWLQANGTKQAIPVTKQAIPVTKKQIDLSTLSGWANLANGQHSITVKAKASGYADSAASNAVSVEKGTQVYTDCLTFTGKTGDFTLKATNEKWNGELEWSTDHNTWTTLAGTEEMQSVDKKLYLRGKGNTVFYDKGNSYLKKGVEWRLSEKADCAGNIQTLLDWENPPAIISDTECYQSMFMGCTNLTSAPELPATTLANSCYQSMFEGCTNLTSAPELPATTLAEACYQSMFIGCTNLTSTPELPATTLIYACYQSMFEGCTNLTSAPELPATTLAEACYQSMFMGCTSLTIAPELPATTLALRCYSSMFMDCTSLTTTPELPATTLAEDCYQSMFKGCTSLTTAPELPATTLAEECYQSMFFGCTNLTSAPELPATTLANNCYQTMFFGCTKLKVNSVSGTKIFTYLTTMPDGAAYKMFGNTGGTFTGTPTAGNTYYYTV